MTRRLPIPLVAALSLLSLPANAQTLSLSRPSLAPDGGSILVNVGGDPRPDATLVQNPGIWTVVARSAAAPVGEQVRVSAVEVTQFFSTTGQVRLKLETPLTAVVTEVDVISISGRPARVTWKRRAARTTTLGVFPASRRDKADVFISGAWATAVSAEPLYSLDVGVAAPVKDFEFQSLQWRFSLTSLLKTASSTNLDPDTFAIAGRIGTIFPAALDDTGPYLDMQWEAVRLEFSRKDEATNFTTAPMGVFSVAVARRLRENRSLAAAVDLDASFGLELGTNLRNKIVPGGYGAIVRLVPGVAVHAVFPGAIGLDEIRWTTSYRARILATNEPLIDLRGEQPQTSLEKGVRHEWNDELLLKINPFVGFTLKHEYGSTPPAFKLLDHRGTVGATVMWAWKQ